MFERFASSTRNAVRYGVEEAQRRGDRRVGTDHLLLGVLRDADTAALVGVSIDEARASADALDRKALVAIGIDIGDFRPTVAPRAGIRTQFTSSARSTLQRTLVHTTAERSRRITPKHLLLALAEREQPDAAATLLSELQVDTAELRSRLSGSGG
jgi:ATP-dependent Clp protease ATP-binding subunit ClpA